MHSVHKGTFILSREENQHYSIGVAIVNGSPDVRMKLSHVLSPEELQELNDYKYERRKNSFFLGRSSAKLAIQQIANGANPSGITVGKGVFGFPIVKGIQERISVSISHCEELGISLAYPDEHPVSIDVETINEERASLIENYITEEEAKLIGQFCSHEMSAFLFWTAKESLSKLLKTGLTLDFKIMLIKSVEEVSSGIYVSTFSNFPQYKSVTFKVKNMVCSIGLPERSAFRLEDIFDLKGKLLASLGNSKS